MQRDGLGDIFAEALGNDVPEQNNPAFFVEAADEGQIVLSVCGVDGKRTRLSTRTPAEELLRAVEIDYTQLRDEVMRLWETYPLDGTDRARKKKELARLSEEVRETSELLREIDAAEFLRRIGYDGEAEPTAPEEQGKSEWRERVERSIDFDPWMEYRGTMTLDLSVEDASWEITTAAEQVREARGEHRSLRDKYGRK